MSEYLSGLAVAQQVQQLLNAERWHVEYNSRFGEVLLHDKQHSRGASVRLMRTKDENAEQIAGLLLMRISVVAVRA